MNILCWLGIHNWYKTDRRGISQTHCTRVCVRDGCHRKETRNPDRGPWRTEKQLETRHRRDAEKWEKVKDYLKL